MSISETTPNEPHTTLDHDLTDLTEEISNPGPTPQKSVTKNADPTVASSVSEQVHSIISAAEVTAAQIRKQAKEEVAQMRAKTAAEAEGHINEVREVAASLRQELNNLRSTTSDLLGSVESNSSNLTKALDDLADQVSVFRGQNVSRRAGDGIDEQED